MTDKEKRNLDIYEKIEAGVSRSRLCIEYELSLSHINRIYNEQIKKHLKKKNPLYLYIKEKLKILKQLDIKLKPEQEEHMWSLTREIDVDNFAHRLIMGD